jgi:hypothetical protein
MHVIEGVISPAIIFLVYALIFLFTFAWDL